MKAPMSWGHSLRVTVWGCGLVAAFAAGLATLVSCGGSAGGKDTGATCQTGAEGCGCYGNNTCNAGLTCASQLCVNLNGTGGTGGGHADAGAQGGTNGTGGIGSSGSGGTVGNTGIGGTVGGTGGSPITGTGGNAGGLGGTSGCVCPSGQECTTDQHCVDPSVIDDFADCDLNIDKIHGRNGYWYAAADVGVNVAFAVGTPPTGYSDRRCGAWTTGGPTGNGTTRYALIGVALTTSGSAIDLSGYGGMAVSLEAQAIDFTLKTLNGGYFTRRLTRTAGTQTFTINFSSLVARSDSTTLSLNLAQVTDVQFTVIDASQGYGFVIHALSLY